MVTWMGRCVVCVGMWVLGRCEEMGQGARVRCVESAEGDGKGVEPGLRTEKTHNLAWAWTKNELAYFSQPQQHPCFPHSLSTLSFSFPFPTPLIQPCPSFSLLLSLSPHHNTSSPALSPLVPLSPHLYPHSKLQTKLQHTIVKICEWCQMKPS